MYHRKVSSVLCSSAIITSWKYMIDGERLWSMMAGDQVHAQSKVKHQSRVRALELSATSQLYSAGLLFVVYF